MKRDVSDNKKGGNVERKGAKTPTRSRLNQILTINLTPNEKEGSRSSNLIKRKSPIANT